MQKLVRRWQNDRKILIQLSRLIKKLFDADNSFMLFSWCCPFKIKNKNGRPHRFKLCINWYLPLSTPVSCHWTLHLHKSTKDWNLCQRKIYKNYSMHETGTSFYIFLWMVMVFCAISYICRWHPYTSTGIITMRYTYMLHTSKEICKSI